MRLRLDRHLIAWAGAPSRLTELLASCRFMPIVEP
jgi:hypothetical protein